MYLSKNSYCKLMLLKMCFEGHLFCLIKVLYEKKKKSSLSKYVWETNPEKYNKVKSYCCKPFRALNMIICVMTIGKGQYAELMC